jgi:hypothetical protein
MLSDAGSVRRTKAARIRKRAFLDRSMDIDVPLAKNLLACVSLKAGLPEGQLDATDPENRRKSDFSAVAMRVQQVYK